MCRFDVTDYPELCMAYKIPQGVQVDIAVDVRVEKSSSSQWYYMPMTDGSITDTREPRLPIVVEITADDQLVNIMSLHVFLCQCSQLIY